jgi:hypothetical protein
MRWSPGCACCEPPTALTDCCTVLGIQLTVPESAIIDDVACVFPVYSNLTVEINGHTAASCNINGSYSVPNNLTCLIAGTDAPSSCTWTGRFAQICTIGGQAFSPHIMVWAKGGRLLGQIGLMRTSITCGGTPGPGQYFQLMTFELVTAPSTPDLSGVVNLPPTTTHADWDGSDLTAYF